MAKTKSRSGAPSFQDFVWATVCDQPRARKMIQESRDWLTITSGIGETALADVVIENYLDAAKFLLEHGADVNTRDHWGNTPLIQAAGLGHEEMVEFLLEQGAEVDARNQDLETALFKAVQYGHSDICETLLASGAGVDVQNDMEESLADVVLPRKRAQVMSVLVRHGYREPLRPQ